MRVLAIRECLALAALLVASGPASAAGEGPRAGIEGDWETVIASPRRPWIFVVRLERDGDAWSGVMSAPGLPDFHLGDIKVDSTRVHFRLPPELDALAFDGTRDGERIVGRVQGRGERTPARLTRITPLPEPRDRIEAWRQDLDHAATRLLAYDRSFSAPAREELRQALDRLRLGLRRKSDAEILVDLSRAVALAGNAHTRLRLDPTRQGGFSTELPIRFWWFSDGPYVIRAAPRYRRALRCRVVAIEGHDVAAARDRAAELFAGNASWVRYMSPIYLTGPDILAGLGLTRDAKGATFTFQDADGTRFDLWIRAERIDPDARPAESWQELSPRLPTGRPAWATALSDGPDVPLYLRHPEQPYWFDFDPASGRLYLQYNRSHDAEHGPSLRDFGDSLRTFARGHSIRDVIVDLRLNSGGDLTVARAFMDGLGRAKALGRRGRMFVVTGPCTYSAGLFHAAQLRRSALATFVGEPVGDSLDFWAEGGGIVLPHSGAVIRYSNGFHGYSGTDHPERRPYYEELSIRSLAPDIPAPLSSRDYFSGRDPALEAIEQRLRE